MNLVNLTLGLEILSVVPESVCVGCLVTALLYRRYMHGGRYSGNVL